MFQTMHYFPNWETIKESLNDLAQKKLSTPEIIKKIEQFKYYSAIDRNKQPQFPGRNTLKTLYLKYENELPSIFQKIAKFVLICPRFEVPLCYSQQNKQIIFTKEQILFLYCSMVLCLIPKQQFDKSKQLQSRFNYLMDFSFIFEEEQFKTQTVIQYLKTQLDNTESYGQTLVIQRQTQNRQIQHIIQQHQNHPMSQLQFQKQSASIQDYYGTLKADFANKFLGGGSLMSGCVQQQIMFTNHPQLFTAQLLCEVMKPNQCIFMSGYKKYFKNNGYGYEAAFDGAQTHQYEYDQSKMAKEYITAIDARPFGHYNKLDQFTKFWINRELLKAYVGFNFNAPGVTSVTTGNWGCGAFGGDVRIKFIIQWLACSLAGKTMIYCPFGYSEVIYNKQLFSKIQKSTIGEVYDKLNQASLNIINQNREPDIYKAINLLL